MNADLTLTTAWTQIATAAEWIICQNKGTASVLIFVDDAAPAAGSLDGFALYEGDKGFAHDKLGGRNVYARAQAGSAALAVDAG